MNRHHDISKFIGRLMLLALPFFAIVGLYIWIDPFKVVRGYDSYYPSHFTGGVALNSGHVATATFDNNREAMKYNAFLLGNSRCFYYRISEWEKYLPQGSVPYHFDAAGESLYGIERRLAYASRHSESISDVLIILDYSVLESTTASPGHIFATSPRLCGYRNAIHFHAASLEVFLNPRFLRAVLDYRRNGVVKGYMRRDHILSDLDFYYDPWHNELDYRLYETQMQQGTYFTPERLAVFEGAQFPDSVAPAVVGDGQMRLLHSMKREIDKHKARCKIVISPCYNQIRLNPADVKALRDIFGYENVADFSGVNSWTSDYRNYYETSHYRPHVATEIMRRIYTGQ